MHGSWRVVMHPTAHLQFVEPPSRAAKDYERPRRFVRADIGRHALDSSLTPAIV